VQILRVAVVRDIDRMHEEHCYVWVQLTKALSHFLELSEPVFFSGVSVVYCSCCDIYVLMLAGTVEARHTIRYDIFIYITFVRSRPSNAP